jgi:hypothetical protein
MSADLVRKLMPVVVALLFIGCGSEEPTTRESRSGGGTNNDGCTSLNIVNGEKTTSFPAVSMIFYTTKGTDGGLFTCTGTFVSDNTMITAAHCVPEDPDDAIYYVPGTSVNLGSDYDEQQELFKTGIKANGFVRGDIETEDAKISTEVSPFDIAIIVFPNDTAPATLPIRSTKLKGGESVDLVGFGDTEINASESSSIRTKRHGRNKVESNADLLRGLPKLWVVAGEEKTRTTDGSSTYSLASQGDSGGPLLYNNTITGIASSAGKVPVEAFSEIIKDDAMNIYAGVFHQEAKDIFDEAEGRGAKLIFSDDSSEGSNDGEDSEDPDKISGNNDNIDCT